MHTLGLTLALTSDTLVVTKPLFIKILVSCWKGVGVEVEVCV